jgi:RNA polymerase sigma-70 factor (ECF subfamily)
MAKRPDEPDDWLARVRAGEEVAFRVLWRELQPRLLRYLRVLGCADPDDVASETWLQVVRDLGTFDGSEEDFRRWLFTVGRNRAIDAGRVRQRRPTTALPAAFDGVADERPVEDQVLELISARRAVWMLTQLPAYQAEVVALRVLAGLDAQAVASMLGKSPGAVRVALHRGLRALADDPAVRALALDRGARPHAGGHSIRSAREVDA